MSKIKLIIQFSFFISILSLSTFASTSDTLYDRSVYRDWTVSGNAWSENTGWITAHKDTVYVADDGLSGYLYGENIGFISLSCRNTTSCGDIDYGVYNDAEGNLSGYAWSENTGWIDFGSSTAPYQVAISATGTFSGYAYGENMGFINFNIGAYSATTTWTPRSTRAQCDDGIDNDNDTKIDFPNDTSCSSLTDDRERSSGGTSVTTEYPAPEVVTLPTPTPVSTSTPTTTPRVTTTSTTTAPYIFTRNLLLGSSGEDVKQLQNFLNKKGFIVSDVGPGSKGNETTYYGIKTKQAVKNYQEAYRDEILTPLGISQGTGLFYTNTRNHVNKNNY